MRRASLPPLLGLLALLGCATPERCARRYPPPVLSRERTVTDTVVVTAPARLDTVVQWRHDTLTLERPRVQVRLVRLRDTLHLTATCAPDTVRVPLVRELIRLAPPPPPRFPWWALVAGAAAALLARRLLFR